MGVVSSDPHHAPESTSETVPCSPRDLAHSDFVSGKVSSPLLLGPRPSLAFDHDGMAFRPKAVSDPHHQPLQKDMSYPAPLRMPCPGAVFKEVQQSVDIGDGNCKSKSELILSCGRNFLIFLKDAWSLALTCVNALCSVVNAFSVLLCLLMSLAFASYLRLDTVAAPPRAPPTKSVVFESVQASAGVALERCIFQVLSEFFRRTLVVLPTIPLLGLLNHE